MKKLSGVHILLIVFSLAQFSCSREVNRAPVSSEYEIPHLAKQGQTAQLIVDGRPFIILGGELGNSSFTSLEYMKPLWPRLSAMHLNTILAPVFWELIEPEEGVFDFNLLDELILEARDYKLKLVILWFASWKNSMSSHVPSWVKLNQDRFPLVKDDLGKSHEILTPFSENNLQADLKAFEALMTHLREFDHSEQTVIMVQVENEIGMLPVARDYHPLANEKFLEDTPSELIKYLQVNKENLVPEFRAVWEEKGSKTSGTWEDLFGEGTHTDEIFMAWYFSKYTNTIIEAGKVIYPLPMYVNAALNRPGWKPGEYPSAGPLPHLMDVWKAAGKSIDFLSPDFYTPDFKHWNDLYTRQNNPLFIPEHRFDNTVAAKAAYAIGHYEALGFAPFSIESGNDPENEALGKMYDLIEQLSPLIAIKQGQNLIDGVLLDKKNPESILNFGEYELRVRHSYTLGWEDGSENELWEPSGAIIIQSGEKEFYIAGSGFVITFANSKEPDLNPGILKNEEGRFENGVWVITRHLNGDQTHQGRHIRVFSENYTIQKLKLYDYE
jgi:beta-galactosidase GanA